MSISHSPLATGKMKTKKRQYEERVRNVEHGTFTPLVFSAAGGMGPITITFYKRLASLLSEKLHQSYNQTILWLRCSLSFSLLRSVIMCQDLHVVDHSLLPVIFPWQSVKQNYNCSSLLNFKLFCCNY